MEDIIYTTEWGRGCWKKTLGRGGGWQPNPQRNMWSVVRMYLAKCSTYHRFRRRPGVKSAVRAEILPMLQLPWDMTAVLWGTYFGGGAYSPLTWRFISHVSLHEWRHSWVVMLVRRLGTTQPAHRHSLACPPHRPLCVSGYSSCRLGRSNKTSCPPR